MGLQCAVSLLWHESHLIVHPPAFALESLGGGGKRSDPPTYDGYVQEGVCSLQGEAAEAVLCHLRLNGHVSSF
jgi:hypothetical protein